MKDIDDGAMALDLVRKEWFQQDAQDTKIWLQSRYIIDQCCWITWNLLN